MRPLNSGGYHVTDLLLITDVPRLRKVFSRLADTRDIRLRIANNLEKGAEELVAEKPGIVFVQTQLSGLSAEIILMHLKKQLGRKRTRFVLLSTPAQAGSETVRLYQGHIDTSLDDEVLHNSIKEVIASLMTRVKKKVAVETVAPESIPPKPLPPQTETPMENVPATISSPQQIITDQAIQQEEPSLVDQGLTYAPRPRMSVYSEFNSSFDSAVSVIKPAVAICEAEPDQHQEWDNDKIETIEPSMARSKRAIFLLWLAPVVIAVVVITILQHNRSTPASSGSSKQMLTPSTTPAGLDKVPTVQQQQPATSVAPVQAQIPTTPKSTTETESAISDRAVLIAIAENRGNKDKAKTPAGNSRITTLPDFIPRAGVDKTYATANPGWERYKGQVTEFKIFREGASIKAIQVIDRGGNGVPESFMKGVLRQVSKNPEFVTESSEKKEGYEIQRGHVAENLKVMYYRDDQGGKLRAFVLTWQ
jgi:hypothetical protein